jgi:outer membrane protein assembly factor BamA
MEHVEGSSDGDSDTYDVGFSLSKNLSPRTSTALDLGYRDYDTDGSGDSYTEKRIGVSLTTTWL